MEKVDIKRLRTFKALEGVPDNQLEWLIDKGAYLRLEDGDMLARPGVDFSGVHFIITGSCQAYTSQGGSHREIGVIDSGEITGYLPYSRARASSVFMSAIGDVQILLLPFEYVREMINLNFELTQALVQVMSNRIKYVTSLQLQNEKMMALGKLSAGMTHELNNPASANIRDASYLINALQGLPHAFSDLLTFDLDKEQLAKAFTFVSLAARAEIDSNISLRERNNIENAFLEWMEARDVENADNIAGAFVEFGVNIAALDALYEAIPKEFFSKLINWINDALEMLSTAKNIQESSRRISRLVNAVKTYTHVDRGSERQFTDIHTGIRNTIVMLEHKIKNGNIEVVTDFDFDLPQIKALVGELNQVWTNLIDNALDSMRANHSGILRINTKKDREFVKITLGDDGPGIPENIISMIFDPFFTTKGVGEGTGIGLDLVRGIVNQHKGKITVSSKPGCTEFVVCLPINIKE